MIAFGRQEAEARQPRAHLRVAGPDVHVVEAQRLGDLAADHVHERPPRDALHDLAGEPAEGEGVVGGVAAGPQPRLGAFEGAHHEVPVEHAVGAVDQRADLRAGRSGARARRAP